VGWNLLDASQGTWVPEDQPLLQGALTLAVLWEIVVAKVAFLPSNAEQCSIGIMIATPSKRCKKGRGASGCSHQRLRTNKKRSERFLARWWFQLVF